MTRTTSTALRLVAAGALGLPLTLGIAGVANAAPAHGGSSGCADGGHSGGGHSGGGHSGGGHDGHDGGGHGGPGSGGSDRGGQVASQGGSLVDALAQVDPALNVGGILNSGDVHQTARTANSANSGIVQSRGPGSGGQHSFQAGDVVSALLQVDPAVNVGGIGNSGDVRQVAVAGNSANSGIAQSGGRSGGHEGGHGRDHGGRGHDHGGGHGSSRGGQYAAQGGDLIGLDLQLAPALNLGGILNSGDVHQTAASKNTSNSGISQHR
jgi:hypothetical protein